MHVPDIRKNVFSRALLLSMGSRWSSSLEFVLSHNGIFVGKRYSIADTCLSLMLKMKLFCAYIAKSFELRHQRLGHVNFQAINSGWSRSLKFPIKPTMIHA